VRRSKPPTLIELLSPAIQNKSKPLAVVLAGHNGSGKTSLWTKRLSNELRIPLINADRLTESILPLPDTETGLLPSWAQTLRNTDEKWQLLSQESVRAIRSVAVDMKLPFAFETVFSHWQLRSDGTYESKADDIQSMQAAGYLVVLLFVGLQNVETSILRVASRHAKGGHAVPLEKLQSRFPRTQKAIGHAAAIADMTVMFDNSRQERKAFALTRAQSKSEVLFDCRDSRYKVDPKLRIVAEPWLAAVVGPWNENNTSPRRKK
jgi:predicted ABC-type ATPase